MPEAAMEQVILNDGSAMLFRRLTRTDIPAADALRQAAHWNQTERDWERLIAFNPDGCFAAEVDGRVAGSATTTVYDGGVAWIGMVLVAPAFRGKGIGRKLLEASIRHLKMKNVPSIKLDATPLGEPLYASIGFKGYRKITRMRGQGMKTGMPESIRRARPEDAATVLQLDSLAFGCGRRQVIKALLEDFPERAFVSDGRDGVNGMVLGRRGASADQAGPLAAADDETALALLAAALAAVEAPECVLDVPETSAACMKMLERAGYVMERQFTRMRLGAEAAPERWAAYRVVHCPELG